MTQHRNPAARRKHPEESIEDPFVARTLEGWLWARRHFRGLVSGVLGLALLIAGTLYYRNYRHSFRLQAAQELERVQQAVAAGDIQVANNELQTYLSRFGDTRYGHEARLLLAELHLHTGDPQKAIATLEDAAEELDDPISFQAASLLATAYENAGRPDDAERLYVQIADKARLDFQIRDALAAAARLRANKGDRAGARQLYDRLLALIPQDDPQRPVFLLRHAEVAARPDTQATPNP